MDKKGKTSLKPRVSNQYNRQVSVCSFNQKINRKEKLEEAKKRHRM
jgi:hypothetical protein